MISERVRKMIEAGAAYPLATSSEKEEKDFIKLCSNENSRGPSPKAVEAVREGADEIGQYPESSSLELKEAISEYMGVEPFQICVGNGSDEVMDLAYKAFTDPGDKVLVPIPAFSQYELASRVNALVPKFVELKDFKWNSKDLLEEIDDVEAVFIGRPNNPTGNSIDEKGLKKLLETGKMIIVDEAYGEFANYSVTDWIENYDNLLVLRTFSKIFGIAGLRIGYGMGNIELIEALQRVRPPFSVNRLAQKAAISALEDMDFVEESRKMILEEREKLREELEKLNFEVLPSDANFLMATPSPLGMDAADVCDYLSQKGILIRNLAGFRGAGPEWVRITIGTPEQNKRLIEALKKLGGEKE